MVYLDLYNGVKEGDTPTREGRQGPVIGPLEAVWFSPADVHLMFMGGNPATLFLKGGMVVYDGWLWAGFAVSAVQKVGAVPFDPNKATMPLSTSTSSPLQQEDGGVAVALKG